MHYRDSVTQAWKLSASRCIALVPKHLSGESWKNYIDVDAEYARKGKSVFLGVRYSGERLSWTVLYVDIEGTSMTFLEQQSREENFTVNLEVDALMEEGVPEPVVLVKFQ
ncbi:hypothetical protein M413DRAFT_407429 [Hebeloma cylindrosporum]|uniref:Uncharacterized protein n=1 Tax=Hebeloma cylindrosporum TaxID=76867 RepID=A0A0C2YI35_HEBCY|nr:hypothetical protein M413DRAFT_407429 [Hebeloma cylindrosporum h7]